MPYHTSIHPNQGANGDTKIDVFGAKPYIIYIFILRLTSLMPPGMESNHHGPCGECGNVAQLQQLCQTTLVGLADHRDEPCRTFK